MNAAPASATKVREIAVAPFERSRLLQSLESAERKLSWLQPPKSWIAHPLLSIRRDARALQLRGVAAKAQLFELLYDMPMDDMLVYLSQPGIVPRVKEIYGVDISDLYAKFDMRYDMPMYFDVTASAISTRRIVPASESNKVLAREAIRRLVEAV